MSIMYKLTEPLEVGIGESMPAEFIKEAERSRARTVSLTDEVERLKTENAKLRELCKDWSRFAYDLFDECFGEPEANDDFMALEDRTCELGGEAEQ